MRRRLLTSTLTIVVAILILFGVPLGIVLDRAVHADAKSALQTEAQKVAHDLAQRPDPNSDPTADILQVMVPAGDRVTVFYSDHAVSNLTVVHNPVVADVPANFGNIVRLQAPSGPIDARVRRALLIVVGLGLFAVGAALGLALLQSRRLADPLARLARSATRLGDGDFSLATPRSGVPEIDEIATSLDRGAERVQELLRAERSFSENASHQLRTALTGLQLRIEELALHADSSVRDEAEAALEQCARLLSVIEELLALARTGRVGNVSEFDLRDLVRQHVDDIEPILSREGRRAILVGPQPVPVIATLGAVGQALDILLSNAVRHGRGSVTATVSADERRARVDITDEGAGIRSRDEETLFTEQPTPDGHGIGLALAHTLVTTEGGTISLVSATPAVFRIELPIG